MRIALLSGLAKLLRIRFEVDGMAYGDLSRSGSKRSQDLVSV